VLFPRLPLHWFAGDLFDTLRVVKRLQVPLLVMHGSDDEVIPSWMAHELLGACPIEEKRIHIVDGGLHKDLFVRAADSLIQVVSQFIAGLPPHAGRVASLEPQTAVEQWTDSALRTLRRAVRKLPA
jgi:fermentation-respiration switch protein FrsA (DUF1100 family)